MCQNVLERISVTMWVKFVKIVTCGDGETVKDIRSYLNHGKTRDFKKKKKEI